MGETTAVLNVSSACGQYWHQKGGVLTNVVGKGQNLITTERPIMWAIRKRHSLQGCTHIWNYKCKWKVKENKDTMDNSIPMMMITLTPEDLYI